MGDTGEQAIIDNLVIAINDVNTSLARMCCHLTRWSTTQAIVSLTSTAGTKALPSVTIDCIPTGATILCVTALFYAWVIENTNGANNSLDGGSVAGISQVIQIRDGIPGDWYDAINFVDTQYLLSKDEIAPGHILYGTVDISGAGKVDGNDTYEFQWLLAKCKLNDLIFRSIKVGLDIEYKV